MNAQPTNAVPTTQARRTGPPVAVGQWWKAWVLLTGLGVTALGWLALPRPELPPATSVISSPVSMSAENSRGVPAQRIDRLQRVSTGTVALPGMPEKPAFQAPITRTRRS